MGDQLRQRAAMGVERERAQLREFERRLARTIADALVKELGQELAAQTGAVGARG